MMFRVLDIEKERQRWGEEREEKVIKVLVCHLVVCNKPAHAYKYYIHN